MLNRHITPLTGIHEKCDFMINVQVDTKSIDQMLIDNKTAILHSSSKMKKEAISNAY